MGFYEIFSIGIAIIITAMLVYLALNSIPKQTKEPK